MASCEEYAKDLLKFIEDSPSPYHVCKNVEDELKNTGFFVIDESDKWTPAAGSGYVTKRNDSSLIAFKMPADTSKIKGFHITAAHTDSPSFKIKENPEMGVEEKYVRLNTEKYGSMIMSTWFDRPLSVAGRIAYRRNGRIVTECVNIDRDLCVIPSLAIHMNRDVNKGYEFKAQVDMLPLMCLWDEEEKTLMSMVAESASVLEKDILGHDLFLYVREKGRVMGAKDDFVLSPKLDDLECVYGALKAFEDSAPEEYVNILAIFDNEEVGSLTKQGADSSFLSDVTVRIAKSLMMDECGYRRMVAESFVISADNAHALHPNHPEKADPTNRPVLNGGIVIKYHGGQHYATDAFSAAKMKDYCERAKVPFQTFANNSDIPGGTTLGNISVSHVSAKTVDIGMPQLAMHSAVETGGSKDVSYLICALKEFYRE
ncbi:MAG: M18 family aminopeptidase [Acetatifactor sp.]|nr:M18 family aminopeptidase [Acetatifactor sp.]